MERSWLGVPNIIRLIHDGDREADVYEFFDKAIEDQQDFLVRVVQNRQTAACKLWDKVKHEPSAGEVAVEIPRVRATMKEVVAYLAKLGTIVDQA